MTLIHQIGLIAFLIVAAFISGFFYGRTYERTATLKVAVEAFQNREVINNETANLDPVGMCIAIGGLPNECTDILRGLDKASESQ